MYHGPEYSFITQLGPQRANIYSEHLKNVEWNSTRNDSTVRHFFSKIEFEMENLFSLVTEKLSRELLWLEAGFLVIDMLK